VVKSAGLCCNTTSRPVCAATQQVAPCYRVVGRSNPDRKHKRRNWSSNGFGASRL